MGFNRTRDYGDRWYCPSCNERKLKDIGWYSWEKWVPESDDEVHALAYMFECQWCGEEWMVYGTSVSFSPTHVEEPLIHL